MIEVSVSDVLEALRTYSERPEGGEGARVEELCRLSGHSANTVRRNLARGIEEGTIVASKRVIKRLGGGTTTVNAYKYVAPPKKGKGK